MFVEKYTFYHLQYIFLYVCKSSFSLILYNSIKNLYLSWIWIIFKSLNNFKSSYFYFWANVQRYNIDESAIIAGSEEWRRRRQCDGRNVPCDCAPRAAPPRDYDARPTRMCARARVHHAPLHERFRVRATVRARARARRAISQLARKNDLARDFPDAPSARTTRHAASRSTRFPATTRSVPRAHRRQLRRSVSRTFSHPLSLSHSPVIYFSQLEVTATDVPRPPCQIDPPPFTVPPLQCNPAKRIPFRTRVPEIHRVRGSRFNSTGKVSFHGIPWFECR